MDFKTKIVWRMMNNKEIWKYGNKGVRKKTFFLLFPYFLISLFPHLPILSFAQNEKQLIRDGNNQFKEKKFNEAEINYRKSLQKNKESVAGTFNLGDALYKQEKFDAAGEQFKNLADQKIDKENLANTYHNLGNSFLKQKKYKESVDAFKNALKNNPSDADTKYNLAYSQAMMKQQQKQQQQNKNDKNQNKKDDKKNQDNKNQEQKDKQDQQKQNEKQEQGNKNKDKQKEQQAKNQQQKISKEDAERMLEALNNQEKDTQKKLQKKQGVKVQVEKDW